MKKEKNYRNKNETPGSKFFFLHAFISFLDIQFILPADDSQAYNENLKGTERSKAGKLILRAFSPHNQLCKVTHNKQHLPLTVPLKHCKVGLFFFLN